MSVAEVILVKFVTISFQVLLLALRLPRKRTFNEVLSELVIQVYVGKLVTQYNDPR